MSGLNETNCLKSRVQIKEHFYVDGNPLQILSGSIHYFRVVPEYWRDRLEKLKNMGCNTVETYIPWNFHEAEKGSFNWSGAHDVCRFLEIAQELGLYIIVRPSPYICAEWEWGGLPAWLLQNPKMRLRCSDPDYLKAIRDYYQELIPKLVPYQIDNGGKIILVQVENEYGYYGDDTAYMQYLADLMREFGITVPFVTSDGPWNRDVFTSGQIPDVLPTGNFGSGCEWQFSQMKKMMPEKLPLMNMEFWAGWFDAWGGKKKKASKLTINKLDYDYVVKNGHNINIYMFHGGTNFGFMNGANYYGKLTPDTTSYDYDAPLSEDGQFTKKYFAFRDIIKKHKGTQNVPDVNFSTKIERKAYGKISWFERAELFENLEIISKSQKSVCPISMEEAGQSTGYILYRTKMKEDVKASELIFKKCADRVIAFSNQKKQFTAFDKEICSEQKGHWPFTFKEGKNWKLNSEQGATLDFLVENLGRVNFGHKLEEQKKGIYEEVLINTHGHYNWEVFTLPLDKNQMSRLIQNGKWHSNKEKMDRSVIKENPAFFKFEFDLELKDGLYTDTYLDFEGWGKGSAFVNGFNIGRFWDIGPQKTLYIPGPLLKNGKNEIIIFETEGKRASSINLCDKMKWIR